MHFHLFLTIYSSIAMLQFNYTDAQKGDFRHGEIVFSASVYQRRSVALPVAYQEPANAAPWYVRAAHSVMV
jgi:hypothetical protein